MDRRVSLLGTGELTMRRQPIHIDRDKLRAAIRKLGNQHIFYMLSDAIDLLPPAKLHKIAKKYLHLERLRPDAEEATRSSLLADVKRFEKASLAGEYYVTERAESAAAGQSVFRHESVRIPHRFRTEHGLIPACDRRRPPETNVSKTRHLTATTPRQRPPSRGNCQ